MQIKAPCGLGRLGCLDGSTGTAVECPLIRVKTGKAQCEQMFSGLPPDSGHCSATRYETSPTVEVIFGALDSFSSLALVAGRAGLMTCTHSARAARVFRQAGLAARMAGKVSDGLCTRKAAGARSPCGLSFAGQQKP